MCNRCPTGRPAHPARTGRRDGFVLPLVLVFLLVLATLSLIGVNAADRGQTLARSVQSWAEAERRLASSEARAIFQLITAQPAAGGIATDQDVARGSRLDDTLARPDQVARYWAGNGGLRRDSNGVVVGYQDAAGLVSVNTGTAAEIATVLGVFDIDPATADTLAARLQDYRDEDRNRRFRGAEAPTYRLYGRPEPTNSPFRTLAELSQVLGWADHPQLWRNQALARFTTLAQRNKPVSTAFAPEPLAAQFDDETIERALRQLGSPLSSVSQAPSSSAHLTLRTPITGPDGPRTLVRTLWIERTAAAADRPYTRKRLVQETRDGSASDDTDGSLPPLLQSDP